MLRLAVALNIILTSGEVPHEVAPIHIVDLVGEEEAQVVYLRRHFAVVGFLALRGVPRGIHVVHGDVAQPTLVILGVCRRIDAREEHLHG